MSDDLWRSRILADGRAPARRGDTRRGTPAFLGKVTSTGAALAVGNFVKVVPAEAAGVETDGASATVTAGSLVTLALAIGPAAPATNDLVVVRRVGYRWAFDKQAIGGGVTPTPGFTACCPSNAMPATLSLTFTFRAGTSGSTYDNRYQNTTLTYSTTFPSYTPGLGTANRYFSPLLPLTDSSGNQMYYQVTCATTQLSLGLGQVGPDGTRFGSFACQSVAIQACSPFLASGVVSGGGCADGFGATGDNMVMS